MDEEGRFHFLVKPSPLDLISTQSPLSLKTGPLKPLQPEEVQYGLLPLTHTRLQGVSPSLTSPSTNIAQDPLRKLPPEELRSHHLPSLGLTEPSLAPGSRTPRPRTQHGSWKSPLQSAESACLYLSVAWLALCPRLSYGCKKT